MPFKITSHCTSKDTICEDICAYDCIQTVDAAPANGGQHFRIDEEQCTDCGACALACPQGAIVYDEGFAHYQTQPPTATAGKTAIAAKPIGEWNAPTAPPIRSFNMTVEIPDGYLVLNGKVESWARLMAGCCD